MVKQQLIGYRIVLSFLLIYVIPMSALDIGLTRTEADELAHPRSSWRQSVVWPNVPSTRNGLRSLRSGCRLWWR